MAPSRLVLRGAHNENNLQRCIFLRYALIRTCVIVKFMTTQMWYASSSSKLRGDNHPYQASMVFYHLNIFSQHLAPFDHPIIFSLVLCMVLSLDMLWEDVPKAV